MLIDHAAAASREIRLRVAAELPELRESWRPATVVHRDLYEEQVLLGERVGLIDLDDAALGPPELDVGNLLAHLDLLELRTKRGIAPPQEALLAGYAAHGPLDPGSSIAVACCRGSGSRASTTNLACSLPPEFR